MNALYLSRTTHVRFTPFERRFEQRLLYVYLDLANVVETRLFKRERFGLFSFHEADHGDGRPLRAWAEETFAAAAIALDGGSIGLLTSPRVLGYVFNPISLFIGHGPDGAPRGVIYQVNNTFGERHFYVAALEGAGAMEAHAAEKRFHVSPFLDVRGSYEFRLRTPAERFALTIENYEGEKRTHLATLIGARAPLDDPSLLAAFLSLPFSTLRVIFAIHWHALFLWARGARYRPKPAPPATAITLARRARTPDLVS